MDNWEVSSVNAALAKEIQTWAYPGQYSFYNPDNSSETFSELTDGSYYAIVDKFQKEIIGYFCLGSNAQVKVSDDDVTYSDTSFMDLGLGLKPTLCDKGLGIKFLDYCIHYIKDALQFKFLRLTVAEFNQRAIKTYRRQGFVEASYIDKRIGGKPYRFIVMHLH
ncbi:MAG: GNAT family N-acetyltransferase [Bacteroidota bacterium]|nr:GNAT family N-acetyltransferase [Bacteroidota bacterium]